MVVHYVAPLSRGGRFESYKLNQEIMISKQLGDDQVDNGALARLLESCQLEGCLLYIKTKARLEYGNPQKRGQACPP